MNSEQERQPSWRELLCQLKEQRDYDLRQLNGPTFKFAITIRTLRNRIERLDREIAELEILLARQEAA